MVVLSERRVSLTKHNGKFAGQSAFEVHSISQIAPPPLTHWVEPSTRLRQRAQPSGQVAGQDAQAPLLQLGVLPVPHVPHRNVPPQPSGHEPQPLPRLWQVAGVQQAPCSVQT